MDRTRATLTQTQFQTACASLCALPASPRARRVESSRHLSKSVVRLPQAVTEQSVATLDELSVLQQPSASFRPSNRS